MEAVDGATVVKQQILKDEEVSEDSVVITTCELALKAYDLQIARARLDLKKKLQKREELASMLAELIKIKIGLDAEESQPESSEEKGNQEDMYRPCGFCGKDVQIKPSKELCDNFFFFKTDETIFCSYDCVEKWCERTMETFTGDYKP